MEIFRKVFTSINSSRFLPEAVWILLFNSVIYCHILGRDQWKVGSKLETKTVIFQKYQKKLFQFLPWMDRRPIITRYSPKLHFILGKMSNKISKNL